MKRICVNDFKMWNVSFAAFAGLSPKVKWTCGKCNSYNESRFEIDDGVIDLPTVYCEHCGQANYLPITNQDD